MGPNCTVGPNRPSQARTPYVPDLHTFVLAAGGPPTPSDIRDAGTHARQD